MHFKSMKLGLGAVLLLLAVLLAACSSSQSGWEKNDSGSASNAGSKNNKETITWEYYGFMSPTNFMHKQAVEFAEKVKEATGGRLEIIVHPGGELPYNVAEVPNVVGKGQVDMGDNLVAYSSGLLTVGPISTLPYLAATFDDAKTIRDTLASYMNEEYGSFGADVLFTYPWPQQQLWGKGDPIKKLDDIKGKKLRVVGKEWADLITMFGGTPVTIGPNEVPEAIERGVMNGFHTAATTVATNGWQDFTEWVYKADMASGGISYIIVNKEKMNALPSNVREILLKVAKEHEEKIWSEMERIDDENYKKLVDSGLHVYKATPEDREKALNQFTKNWDNWAKARGPKAEEALAKVKKALGK